MNERIYWRLEGRTPVPCDDVVEWASKWGDPASRRVAFTRVGDVDVSTVFLSADHNFTGKGPPVLFETMVFGGEHDQWQERCCTWDEAEAMHARAVAMVSAG